MKKWTSQAEVRFAEYQGAFKRFLLWSFGVVLPLGILLFEWFASFCGSVFFDPIPTVFHGAWIVWIAAVNLWVLRQAGGLSDKWRGAAVAFAGVGAMFYGLLFLPLLHLSLLAVLFMGMGLLSLTPVITAWATWRLGRNARQVAGSMVDFKQGWRMGLMVGLIGLLALEGPGLWTRANLQTAAGEGDGATAAIERLRVFHSEKVLLKACYEGNRGTQMGTDVSGWILNGWRIPGLMFDGRSHVGADSENVRDVFFRVTGKPFNSLMPPGNRVGAGWMGRGADPLAEMAFDAHHGGDEVAVRIKNLDLAESRFDGHVDAGSELGYGEWTMVFKNGSATAREARCHILLPRDGRVSRLTLWVNGEPMEAALNTVSKVKAAYRAVAVVQRLDPVLVNVVAPDTVMMQCFPVPAHGEMKIRIGITAPLDAGTWEMPRIIERNFGLAKKLESAVWLQGDQGFSLTGNGEPFSSMRDGEAQSLAATLAGESVLRGDLVVKMGREPVSQVVWCEDRFANDAERFLIREPVTRQAAPSGKPVMVIDGSAAMREMRDELLKLVPTLGERGISIILADDGAKAIAANELGKHRFSGGRDNEPALREALRLAKENGGPVVWIHGPQAVGLSHSEAIMQLLERGQNRPMIYAVEGFPGPNRLAQMLYKSGP